MASILDDLKEQQAEARKKLRAEFFALVSKQKPTIKDAARLGDVAKELGWPDRFITGAVEVLETVRRLQDHLKRPGPTGEDVLQLQRDLSKLIADFNERAKEHDQAREALRAGSRRRTSPFKTGRPLHRS